MTTARNVNFGGGNIARDRVRRQADLPPLPSAPAPDWLAQLLDIDGGDVIGTDIAAMILNRHSDMARKRTVDAIARSVVNPIWNLKAGTP
jgi:hypothetical protein